MSNRITRRDMQDWPVNLLNAVAGDRDEDQWEYMLPPDIGPTVMYVLAQLEERHASILYRHYHNLESMAAIGKSLGCTRETVRIIEAHAIRQLQTPRHMRWLINGVSGMLLMAKETAISDAAKDSLRAVQEVSNAIQRVGGIPELIEHAKLKDLQEGLAQGKNPDDIHNVPIQKLDLPARAFHALTRAGINTCGQLVEMDHNDFYNTRNLGRKTIEDVWRIMHQNELYFKNDPARKER